MQSTDIFRQITLGNGLEIIIRELTRVYFGDYHLVRLEIVCRACMGAAAAGADALTGAKPVEFRRLVERMGVPSADIQGTRQLLVQDFLNNSLAYLSAADFPAKLARSVSRQPKKITRTFVETKG